MANNITAAKVRAALDILNSQLNPDNIKELDLKIDSPEKGFTTGLPEGSSIPIQRDPSKLPPNVDLLDGSGGKAALPQEQAQPPVPNTQVAQPPAAPSNLSTRQTAGVTDAIRIDGTDQVITIGDKGRLISSEQDLLTQGFTKDEVRVVTAEEAFSLGVRTADALPKLDQQVPDTAVLPVTTQPIDEPILDTPLEITKEDFQDGQFVQVPGDEQVFIIKDGEIRRITSPEVGVEMGLIKSVEPGGGFQNVTEISQEVLASFRVGNPISGKPSITDNPEQYVLDLYNQLEITLGDTELGAQIDEIGGDIGDLIRDRTSKSSIVEAELERRGVGESESLLTNLNDTILTQSQILKKLPDDIRANAEKFFVTEGQMRRLIADEMSKPSEALAELLQQRGVIKEQITIDTEFAFAMADTKYEDEAAKIDALKWDLRQKEGKMSKIEAKMVNAMNFGLDMRKEQIIREQNVLDQEKGLVLSLLTQYPAANIKSTDSLETAIAKAKQGASEFQQLQIDQLQASLDLTRAQINNVNRPPSGGENLNDLSIKDQIAIQKFNNEEEDRQDVVFKSGAISAVSDIVNDAIESTKNIFGKTKKSKARAKAIRDINETILVMNQREVEENNAKPIEFGIIQLLTGVEIAKEVDAIIGE